MQHVELKLLTGSICFWLIVGGVSEGAETSKSLKEMKKITSLNNI